jgi:hypothetical protein
VSFRRTCQQALGRGGYLGGLIGLAASIVLGILVVTGVFGLPGAPGYLVLFVPLAPVLLGTLVGGLLGLVFCRHEGADIDDVGIRYTPRREGGHTTWRRIEDLRAERRGGRTRVAVYVESGQIGWLQAPYQRTVSGHRPRVRTEAVHAAQRAGDASKLRSHATASPVA